MTDEPEVLYLRARGWSMQEADRMATWVVERGGNFGGMTYREAHGPDYWLMINLPLRHHLMCKLIWG